MRIEVPFGNDKGLWTVHEALEVVRVGVIFFEITDIMAVVAFGKQVNIGCAVMGGKCLGTVTLLPVATAQEGRDIRFAPSSQ